jgi:hypothetical protein
MNQKPYLTEITKDYVFTAHWNVLKGNEKILTDISPWKHRIFLFLRGTIAPGGQGRRGPEK